jgi:hypothetical protein
MPRKRRIAFEEANWFALIVKEGLFGANRKPHCKARIVLILNVVQRKRDGSAEEAADSERRVTLQPAIRTVKTLLPKNGRHHQ